MEKTKEFIGAVGIVEGLQSKKFWAMLVYIFVLGSSHYFGYEVSNVMVISSGMVVATYIIAQSYIDSSIR